MKRKSWLALGLVAGFLFTVRPLFGCGDKLVLLGRGIRFQRMLATKHPATILVYLNPGSGISSADREYQLRPLLKLAGHKPRTAATAAELTREIGSGTYDLILADYADAATLEKQLTVAKAKPALIPVMYNPSADQRAAAEKEYSCLLAPAKKNYDLLKVIDQVMATRPDGSAPKCQKTRI
jgi:hypothetical protein